MNFYDIHEQTKYQITFSKPENMEDLSDLFITHEELQDLVGGHYYVSGDSKQTINLDNVITAAVTAWSDKLEASGKKTLLIDDEELLDVLKRGYLSDHTEDNHTKFGRHGDRICYARQWKRKKTKVTQGDVAVLWGYLSSGFHAKFNVWPSHIPRYDRHIRMFKAFKKIVGWRRVRMQMHDKPRVRFFRQIWDNPEEHIK